MKATIFYRIATVLLLLFAVGHTIGFLTFVPPTPEGVAVWDAMNRVTFSVDGVAYSYGHFYRGLGLSVTVCLLFEAWLAWMLGAMTKRGVDVRPITAAFVLLHAVGAVLAWMYVGMPPLVLSVLLVIAFSAAMLAERKQLATAP
ncbi:MAG: hypothetical protein V4555_06835 [Acidobacteriota bacterium]